MFDKINQIFNFSQKALNLYAKRQEILSANIANSDTPGYKSIDFNFKNELVKNLYKKNKETFLKKTSPYHLDAKYENSQNLKIEPVITNQIKTDGNTVDMDRERIEFLNNSIKYQASLVFMKNQIKNMMYVLKG